MWVLQALNAGVLKVMSKMGISTIASYKGAQIFECLGMADEVVNACFVGTASRIAGVGFNTLAEDQMRMHALAFGPKFMSTSMADSMALPNPGDYHWRSVTHSSFHVVAPTLSPLMPLQEGSGQWWRQCITLQHLKACWTMQSALVIQTQLHELQTPTQHHTLLLASIVPNLVQPSSSVCASILPKCDCRITSSSWIHA